MPTLKPTDIPLFLKSPPKGLAAALIFGPDHGLVQERANLLATMLANQNDPLGEIVPIDDADLSSDPDRLSIELQTIPMFGGPKIIRLKSGPRTNPKRIEELLYSGPLQGQLIVEAGDLKKGAKLRSIFEKSSAAYSIACYSDDARSLTGLIKNEMDEAGRRIDQDALQYLQTMLGADRALTRSELQKLILYTEGQKHITLTDIEAIIGDSAALALDTICYAATGGEIKTALGQLDRALSAGHAPQTIVNALSRHISELFQVVASAAEGEQLESAMRKLRPPIFYKRQAEFQSQCRRWTPEKLTKALSFVQETLVRCRTSPDLERAYVERLLMNISQMSNIR